MATFSSVQYLWLCIHFQNVLLNSIRQKAIYMLLFIFGGGEGGVGGGSNIQ